MDSKNYIYKIEIELDDEKIIDEDKYEIADIYSAIRKMFADEGIEEIKNNSHTLVFASNKEDNRELSRFALIETTLIDKDWFMSYVKRFMWFDTLYGVVSQENIINVARKHGLI